MLIRFAITCLLLVGIPVELHASQPRRDLGVSRAELVTLYSKPSIGVKFDRPNRLADGTPRVMGQTGDSLLTIELIGPPTGSITAALVIFANVGMTRLLAAGSVLALVKRVFPDWDGFTDWLTIAMTNQGRKTYRDGIRVECVVINLEEGSLVSFTIDAR